MAASRISSNSPDWVDVAANLVAFEAINNLRIEIRMSAADYHGTADIALTVVANDRNVPIGEAPPLASLSVTCSATRLRSLEACLIHALYLMDSQLAKHELDATVKKR